MNRIGVLRCLAAAVLFGAAAPAASELAGSIPTFTLAGLLYVGAALAALPTTIRRPPTSRALASEWRPVTVAVIAGGAVGPVLLMAGLARTSASTASILLNAELAATVVLASLVFREHLGRRMLGSAVIISVASALLSWQPGASVDVGAVLIVLACVAWGFDNGVTAAIEQLSPEHVVLAKGVVAGGANLAIGAGVAGWGSSTTVGQVVAALVIGAAGYGLSITLWVKGAQELGAARGQVIFASAPFVGAVIAWTALGEAVTPVEVVASLLAAVGVGVSLRSSHQHEHEHAEIAHDHEHSHDDGHHDHRHENRIVGRHTHAHHHRPRVHSHPHVPDLHHRHDHARVV